MSAIVLLVLHAVGSWVYSVLGLTAAIVSAALVAAVSVLSARMAALGEGNHARFVIPTILFTTPPLVAKLFPSSRRSTDGGQVLWSLRHSFSASPLLSFSC